MSSRGSGRSTRQDRSRRRKTIAALVVAAVLIAVWVAMIAPLAGGSGGSEGSGDSGQSENPQQAGTPDGAGEQAAGGGSPQGGSPQGGSPQGGPSEEEVEDAADDVLSEPPGGGVPDGEVPIEDEEGRSNGQRGFVASFVGAAYGYTGKDPEEYRAGYENRIDTATYYDSAGGKVLEEYAAMVEDGGAENAATLEDYRITSGEPVETQVNEAELQEFAPPQATEGGMPEGATISEVTYAVGDRYGDPSKDEDFGKVYGDVDYLEQRLFLSREEGGWRIVAASAPQPTEPPKRLDPDAPKVAEPQGPGIPDHEH